MSRNIFNFKNFLTGIANALTTCGLKSFKYPSNNFTLSKLGIVFIIFNLTFNIFQIFDLVFKKNEIFLDGLKYGEEIIRLIKIGIHFISFISSLIIILISFILRKKIFKMLKDFENFNKELENLKISCNDARDVGIMYLIWSMKVFSIFFMTAQQFFNHHNIAAFLTTLISVFCIYVPIEVFIGISYILHRRICYILR